jgi:hypothetical protein
MPWILRSFRQSCHVEALTLLRAPCPVTHHGIGTSSLRWATMAGVKALIDATAAVGRLYNLTFTACLQGSGLMDLAKHAPTREEKRGTSWTGHVSYRSPQGQRYDGKESNNGQETMNDQESTKACPQDTH